MDYSHPGHARAGVTTRLGGTMGVKETILVNYAGEIGSLPAPRGVASVFTFLLSDYTCVNIEMATRLADK